MTDNYDDFELPQDFHEVPDVNGLALSFWSEQGLRQPKRWWHPLRRRWDVIKYAVTKPRPSR